MPAKQKKILIIEDEPFLREMYQQKLEQEGFQVSIAATAQQGSELAKKQKPDLILLDILLPKTDGLSFLEGFKKDQKTAQIKVVAFSNFDDPEAKKRAKELKAAAYLIKTNYTPKQIVQRIKKYLN